MLLSQEEQDKLKLNIKENNEKEENNKIGFNEPIPKTNYCNLCQRRFDDYLVHIETMNHKNNISQNPVLISRIQNAFQRINLFWNFYIQLFYFFVLILHLFFLLILKFPF